MNDNKQSNEKQVLDNLGEWAGKGPGRPKGAVGAANRFKAEIFRILEERKGEIELMPVKDLVKIAAIFVPKEILSKMEGNLNLNVTDFLKTINESNRNRIQEPSVN